MMSIIRLCTAACLIASLQCNDELLSNDTMTSGDKRFDISGVISSIMVAGSSIHGTSVHLIKDSQYGVSVSGSIENYSRWPLRNPLCDIESGKMNVPMGNVNPGYQEGFASHKTSSAVYGSYVKCRYLVNTSYLHIMYIAPYNFNHHVNQLGVAVCDKTDTVCKDWDIEALRTSNDKRISRKPYYDYVEPVKKCNEEICINGVMGTSHQPDIDITVYPINYADLAPNVKSKHLKDHFNNYEYDELVAEMIEESNPVTRNEGSGYDNTE